jgi:hypothetical protein
MATRILKNILECVFRSSPAYELIELERLAPAEAASLARLREDPDCFGLLRPRQDNGCSIKSACKDTALLFYSMQHPGRLPSCLTRPLGNQANQQIAELVLDGILEISRGDRFVYGAEAHELIHEPVEALENSGHIARISVEAVKYGQRLAVSEPMRLSAQMYFFHRLPVTPRLQRELGDGASLTRFLGIDDEGASGKLLQAAWKRTDDSSEMLGWKSWTLKGQPRRSTRRSHDYKIYVSPAFNALPEVLPHVVSVLAEKGVGKFKIGADLSGLTRPDKIVAYLHTFEQVEEVGRALAERIGDVTVQGVPFTADLCRNGLISWGMDPHQEKVLDWQESTSWRLWITNRLASALLTAKSARDTSMEPWRFALERLHLEGIDTDTWTPMAGYQRKISRQ